MPPIGITLGDPAGIGPEVIGKALEVLGIPAIIFGPKNANQHPLISSWFQPVTSPLEWIDCGPELHDIHYGKASSEIGQFIANSLERANRWAVAGKISGLVTAPITKEALEMAGTGFIDHTTTLQRLSGSHDVSMAFYSPQLKVILTTIHVPLSLVPTLLTESLIAQKIEHAIGFCRDHGIDFPRIAVTGLNPHAGENGMLGSEEGTFIAPAIGRFLNRQDATVSGPHSADSIFHQAVSGDYDCVVTMTHDQGLIPVKLLAFGSAVNVTLGLPYRRVSPDHGSAYSIAGQGVADPSGMINAIQYLVERLEKNAT